MLDLLLYSLLLALALAAIALNIISLPGNWLILAAAIILCLLHNGHQPHWIFLLLILLILLAAELVEFLSGMIGARKFGASKSAAWAAILGAMLGGLIGIPPITAPTLGTDHIFAAVAGAFLAAWLVELLKQKSLKAASLGALGAALGRGTGLVTKIGAGLLAWFILLLACLIPLLLNR